jgi:hypothetical protein
MSLWDYLLESDEEVARKFQQWKANPLDREKTEWVLGNLLRIQDLPGNPMGWGVIGTGDVVHRAYLPRDRFNDDFKKLSKITASIPGLKLVMEYSSGDIPYALGGADWHAAGMFVKAISKTSVPSHASPLGVAYFFYPTYHQHRDNPLASPYMDVRDYLDNTPEWTRMLHRLRDIMKRNFDYTWGTPE